MNFLEIKVGDTKIVLEPFNEHDEYKPHLFIFKNDVAVMLDESEIFAICELTKDM